MSGESRPIPDWIAVDWGTTNLRAWAMRGETPVDEASSPRGMAGLARADFEDALIDLVEPWLRAGTTTDVIACGMVGSRQGWVEAGYEAVPCFPRRNVPMVVAPSRDHRIRVHVAHGLKQNEPPDVMRGEETQIAGLLVVEPDFEGTVCLPGTHTKWASVSVEQVRSFATFMTGELFALLSRHSVLRHTVADEGWDETSFLSGIDDAVSDVRSAARHLFGLRAGSLLGVHDAVQARSRLSGLLLGLELSAMAEHARNRDMVVIGSPETASPYNAALERSGINARMLDATRMTLAGLHAAHISLQTRKVSP